MKVITLLLIYLLICDAGFSQTGSDHLREWQDNKFSMFIHFGIYFGLDGVWCGQNISFGYSGRNFILNIDGKQTPISLTGGKAVSLPRPDVKWGDVYTLGEAPGLIGSLHGDVKDIDVNQQWSKKDWIKMSDWNNTKLYEKAADNYGNWYWFQEISSSGPADVLAQLPLNDGVSVFLNGKELFTINNPSRDQSRMASILLPLTNGSNKLLVKYFNRFGKSIKVGALNNSPQVVYEKSLTKVEFEKGKTYEIMLQLPSAYPIHQNIDAPNVEIKLN
jgi:hypothetical protein